MFVESELYDDNMDLSVGDRKKQRIGFMTGFWILSLGTLFLSMSSAEVYDQTRQPFGVVKAREAAKGN
jgi:hypothetical protein